MHDDCRTTRLSNFRILSNLFFDALPKDHSIFALTEFDITELRQSLRTQRRNGSKLSLFSHVLKAIATTLAANPEFNSIRHGNKLLIYK